MEVSKVHEKFLLVSNFSRFASVDCYSGIARALGYLGVEYRLLPVHDLQAFFSPDMISNLILAYSAKTINSITHVLFVGSAFVEDHFIKSIQKCGIKVAYWALEDPHSLDQNAVKFCNDVDYYFTNEVKVPTLFPKAYYLPTAADHFICKPIKDELIAGAPDYMKYDIVFCGNVYPNRQKLLEPLAEYCEKKGYKFGLAGIVKLMENAQDSPLIKNIIVGKDEYGRDMRLEGVIDHGVIVDLYRCAKIALNIERDPHFSYSSKYSSNVIHNLVGESLNPRAYEIGCCAGAIQFIDDKRQELFSGNTIKENEHCVVYHNFEDLCQKIDYYLSHEEERKKIVMQARQYVFDNHTYVSRAERMLKYIRVKEHRLSALDIQKVLDSVNKRPK